MKYLVFVGAIINLILSSAYVKDMFRGKAKPNRVSWFIWSTSGLIAGFAALSAGVGLAVVPVFVSGLIPLSIFILSLFIKNAYWKIDKFDYICGILSILALILWYITNEPIVAIIFAILSDAFASIPTIVKSWKYPETESTATYIGGLLSLLTSFAAVEIWNFESLAFPSFSVVICIIIIIGIKRGRLFKRKRDD